MIIRVATPADAFAMAQVLNRIIALGGTTAHETAKSVQQVLDDYITGPDVLSCVVALDEDQVIGWQSVGRWQDEAHIGTFVTPDIQARGAGAAMFALTCDTVQKAGVPYLIASIRADNEPGLRYYARMGFVDFASEPHFALSTGQIVGRIHRRFDVV
jgi:L-amino acid N-acyltransferase YncA